MARISEAAEGSKLKRAIDDVVWTAVREDALELELPDGRRLLIGGEIADYGDEYADPWVYNDIIVTHPDGAIEILTYPREVFPHMRCLVGATMGACGFIFGIVDRKRHPGKGRGPLVLRLDTSSCEIVRLPAAPPPVRVALYKSCEIREGNRVVLPVVRDREADPHLRIAFDLETLAWSEPFPNAHRAPD
jgi:hypothetical protein